MKFKFNSNLDYQTDAVRAVTDLFKGQKIMHSDFALSRDSNFDLSQGMGNKLDISKYDILNNLRKVQERNNLPLSNSLDSLDFNIEMETGTGKTYVYLKTIFELNKLYGLSKFIIVVPNVAIKEGVFKFISMSKKHFTDKYNVVDVNAFIYNSADLVAVEDFSRNTSIQIMIINIDSFNKSFKDPEKDDKANIIHRENDRLEGGRKPIEFIQRTNPIVIIDEPQSVATTEKAKIAIDSLNPLCTLRYSATHKEIQNMVYSLNPMEAYKQHLVKEIEVAGFKSSDYFNKPYLRLVSVSNKNSNISASIELDINKNASIKRSKRKVKKGDDLAELTGRDLYQGYVVDEISCEEDNEFVSFTQKGDVLRLGQSIGGVDDLFIKREQIRKTIEKHLDKELTLKPMGIKVLSLFFIDKVSNYREYNADGSYSKGVYAEIFEEEYEKLIKDKKYAKLDHVSVDKVHNGYFSKDKKGKFKETRKKLNSQDEDTFNLIMRDKETLLSFDSPLKFIFSHSALREGWDNPNVFQICTLNDTKASMKKRQEIGRGLRLCVNQDGERIHDDSVNILTIMANESYENFASELQSEMEKDLNIKFGVIDNVFFKNIVGKQRSQTLFNEFKGYHYINKHGKIKPKLREDIKNNCLNLPDEFENNREAIMDKLQGITREIPIRDADNRRDVKIKDKCFNSNIFRKFWDKIKRKTTYSVDFSTDELIEKCIKKLNKLDINTPSIDYGEYRIKMDNPGIIKDEITPLSPTKIEEKNIPLPDIVYYLQNETFLTRNTIIRILTESDTLNQFKKNPQEYMTTVAKKIKSISDKLIIENIKYTKIDECYDKDLFKEELISGYVDTDLIEANHSIYDYIKYDSKVEKDFADNLNKDKEICLYTKLPSWFNIKTPIGNYNPDWAGCLNDELFVIETKGNVDSDELRNRENCKIHCGEEHFKALNVKFKKEDDYTQFKKDFM